ncbi:GATOR2 complex protein WDR24-like isoform X2 [Panulirus ornatus]|uniref:GATOR2 complex protein WDR24-like isoform X2 n=1 Tax=Panulirus ornatus TaxID=150431 RepID=UPI003A8C2968
MYLLMPWPLVLMISKWLLQDVMIFSIEDDDLIEKANLRAGKHLNLNFSCNDVVWNPVEDCVLAMASTNGAVVTWNLNKSSRSKLDCVFNDHSRTVHKVSFHQSEPH